MRVDYDKDQLAYALANALKERDEAREDLKFRRELYKVQEQYLETARRERDEAKEHLSAAKHFLNKYITERDEARESLKHITEYGTEEINAAVELRQKLASALVERDEARDKYDKLATEHMLAVNKLCEESDEAREQVNRYRYNLDLLPIKWDI